MGKNNTGTLMGKCCKSRKSTRVITPHASAYFSTICSIRTSVQKRFSTAIELIDDVSRVGIAQKNGTIRQRGSVSQSSVCPSGASNTTSTNFLTSSAYFGKALRALGLSLYRCCRCDALISFRAVQITYRSARLFHSIEEETSYSLLGPDRLFINSKMTSPYISH